MDNTGNLTPPWYTLRNEFFYTFGNNPLINVKQLSTSSMLANGKNYLLEIIAKEDDLSFALRQVIKPNFNFGLINVQTIVKNSMGAIEKKLTKIMILKK